MGCSSSQINHRRVNKKQKEGDYSTTDEDERGVPDGQESFRMYSIDTFCCPSVPCFRRLTITRAQEYM